MIIFRISIYIRKFTNAVRIAVKNITQNFSSPETPKRKRKSTETRCFSAFIWRRVRDLNPGCAHHAHTISNRAPSTTQPTLHLDCSTAAEYAIYYSASINCRQVFSCFFVYPENQAVCATAARSLVCHRLSLMRFKSRFTASGRQLYATCSIAPSSAYKCARQTCG